MVGTTFRERLAVVSKARIEEAKADTVKTLAAGGLPDHATYRYHCGILQGLEIALAAIDGAETDLQKG